MRQNILLGALGYKFIFMTQEEHDLLVANNKMLQDIIQYIGYKQSTQDLDDFKDFFSNVAADLLVTKKFQH